MTGIEVFTLAQVRAQHDRAGRVSGRRTASSRSPRPSGSGPASETTNEGETEANGTNCWVETCHGIVPLVPPSAATSPKMTPVQVPGDGVGDVHVAVVAHALGQAVRSESPERVDEDQPHPGVVAVRRVARVGDRGVEAVLARAAP